MRLFYFLSLLNLWGSCVSVSHDSIKVDLTTALFSCSMNVVVLPSPPFSKIIQSCLRNVANVLACIIIIILRQCLTLQGLQGTTPVPTFCPCGFVLSCAYMYLGLCFFLLRWSVICCQDGCFMVRQRRIARRVSQSHFWRALLGASDIRLICCLSCPSGVAPLIPGSGENNRTIGRPKVNSLIH